MRRTSPPSRRLQLRKVDAVRWTGFHSVMKANLNHLHLHVASVERARVFYERYFGMRESAWHGGVFFMRDDVGMDLALAQADKVEPFPEWFHFGFRLGSGAEVAALFQRAKDDGVAINAPLEVHGDFSFFRCSDPDGYLIEVYYEPDPQP